MITRRSFTTGLGAAGLPLGACKRQQQTRTPVIGFLSLTAAGEFQDRLQAFHLALGEAGYVEGRNVAVEYRWAGYNYERLNAMAAELVERGVDVLAVTSVNAVKAVKAVTTSIPIVFYIGVDPVETGLVSSLNRPGGNLTGTYIMSTGLMTKRLAVMHETVPKAETIAVLMNPSNLGAEKEAQEAVAAAAKRGVKVHLLRAASDVEIEAAFSKLAELKAQALVIGAELFFYSRSQRLAELSAVHKIPAMHQFREFVAAGGLMSYGSPFTYMYRLMGSYTSRILKGEAAGDLPVQQPTRFELVVNLKAAKSLGLDLPATILGTADEVIE